MALSFQDDDHRKEKSGLGRDEEVDEEERIRLDILSGINRGGAGGRGG